jgi:hypothetical protein
VTAGPTRTFRVFVSSTFDDMQAERDHLQTSVFPRLDRLCRAAGARFQAVDLRWGVSTEAQRSQRTMTLCLDEIARSRVASPRPHFMFLLGDRYGWVPLPEQVPADEYERLVAVMGPERALVEEWYLRDDNAAPPHYVLRSREVPGAAPGDPGWEEAEGAERARWAEIETRLRDALTTAADLAGVDASRYVASATEQEIVAALFGPTAAPDAADHIFGFIREPSDPGPGPLAELTARLKSRLPADHIVGYAPGAVEVLGDAVFTALRRVIRPELEAVAQSDSIALEAEAHATFAAGRRRGFVGREKQLKAVGKYLKKYRGRPLVVHGEPGSGKSAFMAQVAAGGSEPLAGAVIVQRFIGATPASVEGRLLLTSIAAEIAVAYGAPAPETPGTLRDAAAAFAASLALGTPARPLVVLVDSLDQFVADDPARSPSWVPGDLPEHARLIVSTTPGEILDALSARFGEGVEIDDMPPKEAVRLLSDWLTVAGRTITDAQRRAVMSGYEMCRRPLYLRLASEEARRWASYSKPEGLPGDIDGIVGSLFDRLARDDEHGRALVSSALGYLAAARNGLTEDEMLDVLSADPDVVADQRRRSPLSPEFDRLPQVVWSRLRADLSPYLAERAADGTTVMGFFHRAVAEAAERHFLAPLREQRHSALADRFAKRSTVHDGVPDRRKLSELPHQLTGARRKADLEALLTDFEFLDAKNRATGPQSIVDDCTRADRAGSGTAAIDAVLEAMRISSSIVGGDPDQLAGQLTSRLLGSNDDVVSDMLGRIARVQAGPWLRPLMTPSARPGGALLRTIPTGQGCPNI